MANSLNTTASRGAKAVADFTPTIMSFFLLLRRFNNTMQTERTYQASSIDLFAPDMADELRELEVCWEELTETVFDVVMNLPDLPEDRDLHRVAFLMKVVLEIEEPSDRAHMMSEARKHRALFTCISPGVQGEITAQLIQRFFVIFDEMSALRQFGGVKGELPCQDFFAQLPA